MCVLYQHLLRGPQDDILRTLTRVNAKRGSLDTLEVLSFIILITMRARSLHSTIMQKNVVRLLLPRMLQIGTI